MIIHNVFFGPVHAGGEKGCCDDAWYKRGAGK